MVQTHARERKWLAVFARKGLSLNSPISQPHVRAESKRIDITSITRYTLILRLRPGQTKPAAPAEGFLLLTPETAKPQPPLLKMSLVTLSHVCSHLQNASRARLGLTSVPLTNLTLTLLLSLQNQGFIHNLTRGSTTSPHDDSPVTQHNISSRRLWLGLKYWNNEPVLKKMSMESRPTKRIWLDKEALGDIVRGKDAGYVKGLRVPGECLFVSTDRGIFEAREAVERRIGGMVLCRAL